jgi:hypothetical protein
VSLYADASKEEGGTEEEDEVDDGDDGEDGDDDDNNSEDQDAVNQATSQASASGTASWIWDDRHKKHCGGETLQARLQARLQACLQYISENLRNNST